MKKLILITLLFASIPWSLVWAEENNSSSGGSATETVTKTLVSAPTPGFDCVCAIEQEWNTNRWSIDGYRPAWLLECQGKNVMYICTAPSGVKGVSTVFARIVRWIIDIALILWVLGIAVFGVVYAISGAGEGNPALQKNLKEWGMGLVVGLIILFFFQNILKWLAPWIYQ